MRCFFKLLLLLFIVLLCVGAVAAYQKGDASGAFKAGGAALVLMAIGALSGKKKTKAKTKAKKTPAAPGKMPKYMETILIQANRTLQRETFFCRQCSKKKPIKDAAIIDVIHSEEFINDNEDDLRTKKTHDYGGLICKKCAWLVSGVSTEDHSYIDIPDELRATK